MTYHLPNNNGYTYNFEYNKIGTQPRFCFIYYNIADYCICIKGSI